MGLFLYGLNSYSLQCSSFLKTSIIKSEGVELLESFEAALKDFTPEDYSVEREEVQRFGRRESPLKALQLVAKENSIRMTLWLVLEERIFNSPHMESPEMVKRVERAYNDFMDLGIKNEENLSRLLRDMKAKNKYVNTKAIILILKNYSKIFSAILGRDVDFMLEEGLLEYFGVEKRFELKSRYQDLSIRNRVLFARINGSLESATRHGVLIREELSRYFFGERVLTVYMYDFGFLRQNVSKAETIELIEKLRLPKDEERQFLEDVEEVSDTYSAEDNILIGKSTYVLILVKASESIFGKVDLAPPESAIKETAGQDKISITYRALKNRIIQAEYSRVIVEERMAEYINNSEATNERINSMKLRFQELAEMHSPIKSLVDEQIVKLEFLKISDFDVELDRIAAKLNEIEVSLDELTESTLKAVRNVDITQFWQLNDRWQRLIADKRYVLAGIDYTGVIFSKDVVDYFQKNPALGARYLAVLSKSYVAVKKASGLRRLPSIHPDFRDIKSIRSQGKLRIVGRLVGDTIHFFHIYDSEKGYNTVAMRRIVENFKPN